MVLLHGFDDPSAYRGGFVSIGNFDGVHRGHRSMIALLVRRAREAGAPAVVFTFDPHPIVLLRPEHTPPSLSTLPRKAELLAACGVDCVIAYPTDRALLELSSTEFFERIVRGELAARGLIEGPNFHYGHDRQGDVESLRASCEAAGMTLDVVEPVRFDGEVVSSSRIRALIAAGRIDRAIELLGHPYRVRGHVAAGADRGKTIGYPTANLTGIETLLPADGVYAGAAEWDGRQYPAAINVGPNPTFGDDRRKVEVHLIGFEGDLYGRTLDVDLIERLRDTMPFESVTALKEQLARDVERVRAVANACESN